MSFPAMAAIENLHSLVVVLIFYVIKNSHHKTSKEFWKNWYKERGMLFRLRWHVHVQDMVVKTMQAYQNRKKEYIVQSQQPYEKLGTHFKVFGTLR